MARTDTPRKAKEPLAFRVRPETAQELRERARELGATQTQLVERYIEEGIRMDRHPLIRFREGAAGRRPALVGTRLDVWQVIETIRQNDNSIEDAAEYLGKPVHFVEACLAYYADYRGEIDEWTARANEFAEREEARWRRQQQLLA
jgi:uncharacterized protein (DUF433 family)